jgi:carboxypeptidase C (cathepsin A)
MRARLILGIVTVAFFFFAQSPRVSAQTPEKDKDAKASDSKDKCDAAATKEEVSTTDHTIRIGAQTIPYKATASTTLLKNDKGDATGLLYSVAYTRSDVKDLSLRPVSFLYNGGPGSATMWLHMGAFGPRRVHTIDGHPPLTSSWTTPKACSTKPISSLSTPWAPATATPSAKLKTKTFTG